MGADRKQLPKIPVRYRFSRLPHYDMRRHLRRTGKRYGNRRQFTQRGIFPCRLYRYPLLFPVQIRRTGKIYPQRTLTKTMRTFPAERRFLLGVCTRTQRLIQSQNESRFQPYEAANHLFCGSPYLRTSAFFLAQGQRGDEPCGNGYDCRHAALFSVRHV